MFNNNFGKSSTREDYDWTQIEGIQTNINDSTDTFGSDDDTSYFYQYLVDENAGTYTLVNSFKVPYSSFVSSIQKVDDLIVVNSGMQGLLSVYDEDGNLLQQFKSMLNDKYIYRIYYYDFNGFYFES